MIGRAHRFTIVSIQPRVLSPDSSLRPALFPFHTLPGGKRQANTRGEPCQIVGTDQRRHFTSLEFLSFFQTDLQRDRLPTDTRSGVPGWPRGLRRDMGGRKGDEDDRANAATG